MCALSTEFKNHLKLFDSLQGATEAMISIYFI